LHADAHRADVYPIDYDYCLQNEQLSFPDKDAEGIPLANYPKVGHQHVPTKIAICALAHYNRLRTTDNEVHRREFLKMADWYLHAADGRWYYNFDIHYLKAPWLSAMGQGMGISVLCRAYRVTARSEYLEQAVRAAEPLRHDIREGGVRSQIDGIHDFLEEAPCDPPTHILNGFLYTLFGILALVELAPEMRQALGLPQLISTLENHWERWDTGTWSTYDLQRSPQGRHFGAPASYHRLHVCQLRYLSQKLASVRLAQCADRWEAYDQSLSHRLGGFAQLCHFRWDQVAGK